MPTNAAFNISSDVTYPYSTSVTAGKIRYIAQQNSSGVTFSSYFYSSYWPNGDAKQGCNVASISMALSYLGINMTPIVMNSNGIFNKGTNNYVHLGSADIARIATNVSGISISSVYANVTSPTFDMLTTAVNNFQNGNGSYSPPIVCIKDSGTGGLHFFLVTRKNSDGTWEMVDPISENNKKVNLVSYPTPIVYAGNNNGLGIGHYVDLYQYKLTGATAHTHNYVTEYESAHPHKQYTKCYGCGDFSYTGITREVSTCSSCYPTVTVTFNADGGVVSTTSKQVKRGETFGTLPTPTRTGCTFVGWYTSTSGGSKIVSTTVSNYTTDITLYARWDDGDPVFDYQLNSDMVSYSVKIDSFFDDTITNIVIPYEYNGLPITEIGSFKNCKTITSVTIPNGILKIHISAFSGCANLASITIPDSITTIGSEAFYSTAYYNASENWDNGILYINNHLIEAEDSLSGTYTVKTGTKTIASRAFINCPSLISITIPDSVTNIGSEAFFRCTNLESVTIPNSVTNIGSYAFYGCANLTSITIPDGVTNIGNYTFCGCKSLTAITIPNSVTRIGSCAFYGCTNLTSISIPNSVTSIEDKAFYNCTNLTNVYFYGTYEQWHAVTIGKSNSSLENATIHFIHTCSFGEWQVRTSATCTEDGVKFRTCDCGEEEIDTIAKLGHDFSGEWTIDVSATCSQSGLKSHHCSRCNEKSNITVIETINHSYSGNGTVFVEPTTEKEGLILYTCVTCGNEKYEKIPKLEYPTLKQINGQWVYASGNTIITDFTGLVEYYGNYYHVQNGYLDWNYSGLSYYYGDYYYVTNGVIDWNYTGLTNYYNTWYYVTNGFLDWNVTTLTNYYDTWYYVSGGVLDWNYTGLAEYYGGYYHIANGVLDWNYSGLSYYYGDYYYVTNGCIDWTYTGLTNYYGTWYYVVNGYLDWSVTTLTNYYGTWYYVENGSINWNSNTLVNYCGDWYYTVGGTVAWDYTGWVNYYGVNYYITAGYLDWSKQ